MKIYSLGNIESVGEGRGGVSNTYEASGELLMPQVGSYSIGHSPPHLTYVPTNEAAIAPTLDLAFSTPLPSPHAPDVEEDIMRYESKEDDFLEVIALTPESL